jgi:hypothetical protein
VTPVDLAIHLLSFVAPALAVALLVALAGPLVLPRAGRPRWWWAPVALNFIAGVAVLVAGLWLFGRDGKMTTYSALVLVVATCQWLSGRAWRS